MGEAGRGRLYQSGGFHIRLNHKHAPMVAIICACVARVDSIWAVSRSDDYRRCLQRIDIKSFFTIRQSGTARALLFPTREIAINRRPTVGAPRQAKLPTGTPLV